MAMQNHGTDTKRLRSALAASVHACVVVLLFMGKNRRTVHVPGYLISIQIFKKHVIEFGTQVLEHAVTLSQQFSIMASSGLVIIPCIEGGRERDGGQRSREIQS